MGGFEGKAFCSPTSFSPSFSSSSSTYSKNGSPLIFDFKNVQGLRLRAYGWKVAAHRAIIVGIHGVQSHCRFDFLRQPPPPPPQEDGGEEDGGATKKGNAFSSKFSDGESEEFTTCKYEGSWVENMNNQNISFWGFDLQGHGDSEGWEGRRGNVQRFDDYAEDVITFLNILHQRLLEDNQNPLSPIFLLAISMGGAICIRTIELMGQRNSVLFHPSPETASIQKNETENDMEDVSLPLSSPTGITTDSHTSSSYIPPYVEGCILLSPMLSLENIRTRFLNRLLYPISSILDFLCPHMPVSSIEPNIKFPWIDIVKSRDELVLSGKIPVRLCLENLAATVNSQRDVGFIPKTLKVLFIHSKLDTMCEFEGTEKIFSKMSHVHDKEFWPLSEMWHYLIEEPGNENLYLRILKWMELRIDVSDEEKKGSKEEEEKEDEEEVEKKEQKEESLKRRVSKNKDAEYSKL